MHEPGWLADPWAKGGLRFWDGTSWTLQVAKGFTPPKPPHQQLPLVVAVGAIITILSSLVVSRFLLRTLADYNWSVAVYVVIAGTLGYGPVLLFAWWASCRWGSGSLRDDGGLHFRAVDAGWGPLTWLAAVGAQLAVGVIVIVAKIPLASNTEGIGRLAVNRGYVIALLVLAVIAAPIIEEVIFRGLVLRGLLSRLGVAAAVGVQAVVFGLAHFDPVRGAGNIGLIMVLSGVGAVFGVAEYALRRAGPTIIAHAIMNAAAMAVVLSGWSPKR